MTCYSCIEKLARKLIEHHRTELDLIRALELAEKAVTRVENRPKKWYQKKPPFLQDFGIVYLACSNILSKIRSCGSCERKWVAKYREYGFTPKQARFMAKKLMARIERRKKKERIRESYQNIKFVAWKWSVVCNWRATIYWTLKTMKVFWIGKGYNPDYTVACGGAGTPICLTSVDPCAVMADCQFCEVALSCTCGAFLPHSHQVAKLCTSAKSGGNAAGCNCNTPVLLECFDGRVPNHNCAACANVCTADCDAGFHWTGLACDPNPSGWFDGLAGPI